MKATHHRPGCHQRQQHRPRDQERSIQGNHFRNKCLYLPLIDKITGTYRLARGLRNGEGFARSSATGCASGEEVTPVFHHGREVETD